MDIHRSRIVVIGAGIAGLSIGYRLAQYGLFPVVIESAKQIANGSTTRNEGWLHAGTFHSQSIKGPQQAIRVAQRCIYGHEQFKRFCPDAIEDPIASTIAVTLHRERIPEISERWAAANIANREISKRDLLDRAPSIQIENVEAAWEVREVSINTRLLCHRLACAIESMGGRVICDARLESLEVGDTQIRLDGDLIKLSPSTIVITAGYSTNEVLSQHLGIQLDMRYWRSHLLLSKRILGPNIYGIDPHEANLAHHRDRTIVGANEENTPCAEPSTDVDAAEVAAMKEALGRLMKIDDIERLSAIACMKVDVANDRRKLRNLDVEIIEALPNVICAFPGKMTEAPFLADAVTREIISRNDHLRVKQRPIDEVAL